MIQTKTKIIYVQSIIKTAIRNLSDSDDRHLSTLVEQIDPLESPTSSDYIESSYRRLIESTVEYLNIKRSIPQQLSNSSKVADVREAQSSIEIKKFCSYIRLSTNSPFNRNIIELILLPISKNIFLEEEKLYLSSSLDENFVNYRNFIENDNIREACISYSFSVLGDKQDTMIHSQTTLRSFQENSVVIDVLDRWKQKSTTSNDRHVLLAIFLNLILFEVIQNNREKRSKSRIVNYLVDKLSKSGNVRV